MPLSEKNNTSYLTRDRSAFVWRDGKKKKKEKKKVMLRLTLYLHGLH